MLERGLVAVRVTLSVSKPTTVAQSFNEVNVSDDGSRDVWIHEFVDPDREVTVFLSPSRFALGHFAAGGVARYRLRTATLGTSTKLPRTSSVWRY
jgi:hypothetical protein